MRHINYILAIVAMLILSAVPALAVEGMEASVTGGLEFFSGDVNNAKFNEYRVRREGPWGGFAAVEGYYAKPDGNHEYNLHLNYRSLEDIDLYFDTMSYGEYKFFVNYQRMGHTFATNVKTLYSGDGTGNLSIPDATRNFLNPGGVFSGANLIAVFPSSHTIDLFLTRDRVSTGIDWMSLKPLRFYAQLDYEHREGDRPYGGTFGFGNAIEIPEPIDYDTYNVKAGAEFAGSPIYADVSYNHSTFDNNIQSITYDNIKQLPGVNATANPDRGRNALAPSNSFDSVSVVLAKNLPLNSRAVFNFNYGWLSQNEDLLPATINPVNAATGPLPRGSADTAVDTTTYEVKLTSRPIDKLELKAGYRYYQHDNRTANTTFPFMPYDSEVATQEDAEYVSWISRTVNAEAAYEVFRRTHVGFAWENEGESYRNGSSRTESENTYKVFADSRALDYLTARLTLEYSDRNARYPDYTQDDGELKWLRKYYAADRDRYLANALVTFTPMDSMSVSVDYSYADTRYPNSIFGLHDTRGHVASIDTEYQPAWWLGMNIYYTYENERSRQRSRQWTPGGIGDPYVTATNVGDPNNWNLKTTDETNTIGGGVDIGIIKEKLNLKLDGSYTAVDGDADFVSGIGTAGVNDLNAFRFLPFGHVDETTLIKVGGTFKYKAMKALELSLGYGYEKWDIKDYQYDGVRNVVVTAPPATYRNLLTMNSLYKPYEVHTVFAGATYKF